MQKLAAHHRESMEYSSPHAYKQIVCAHKQLEGLLLSKECLEVKNAKRMTKENLSITTCYNRLYHNGITKCIEQCVRLFMMHTSCSMEREKLESINVLYNMQNSASLRLLQFVEYLYHSRIGSLPLTIVLLISRSLKKFNVFDAINFLEKYITLNLQHTRQVSEYSNNNTFNVLLIKKDEDDNRNEYNINEETFVNKQSSSFEEKVNKSNASYELNKLKMIIELYVSYCAEADKACTVVDENEKCLLSLYDSDILQHLSSIFIQQKNELNRQQKIKVVTTKQKKNNIKEEPQYKGEEGKSVMTTHGSSPEMKFSITKFFYSSVLTKRLRDAYNFLYNKAKNRQILRIIAFLVVIIAAQFVLRKSLKLLFSWRGALIKSPALSLAKPRRRQLAL